MVLWWKVSGRMEGCCRWASTSLRYLPAKPRHLLCEDAGQSNTPTLDPSPSSLPWLQRCSADLQFT